MSDFGWVLSLDRALSKKYVDIFKKNTFDSVFGIYLMTILRNNHFGVTTLIYYSKIWGHRRRYFIYFSAEEYKGFPSGDLNAIVNHDGRVSFIPPKITKSSCYADVSVLTENEEITCVLKYGSWTRSGLDLNLETGFPPEILYNLSPRFNLTSITAKRNVIKYQCCPETYISIDYTLSFLRNF